MRCPNKNLPEWKALVQKVGELEAYLMYVENDYNIPDETVVFNDRLYEKIDKELIDKLKEGSELKHKILQNLSLKMQLLSNSEKSESKKLKSEIKQQIALLTYASVESGFYEFMKHASSALDDYNEMIFLNKSDLALIKKIETYAGAYDVIEEINKHLRKHYGSSNQALNVSQEVLMKLKNLRNSYLDILEKELPKKLAQQSNVVRNHYKQKIRANYVKINPKKSDESKEGFDKRTNNHVSEEIDKIEKKIQFEEEEYVSKLLITAPKDLGAIESWIVDGRQMDDHLIQLVVEQLDKQDFKTKEEFVKDRKVFYDRFSELVDKLNSDNFGKDNLEKLYGDVIEKKDGVITGYLTSEVYSEYYTIALPEFYDLLAINAVTKEQKNEKNEKIKQWKINNLDAKYLKSNQKAHLNPDALASKWKNPQYDKLQKDKTRSELRELFGSMAETSDKAVSRRSRITNYAINKTKPQLIKIPSISKEFIENVETNGFSKAVIQGVKESFMMQQDDYEDGHGDELNRNLIYGNEKGKKIDRISMPFRGKMDSKDLSLDLFNSFMTNHYISLNYKNKETIKGDLLMVKDLMEERGTFKTIQDGKAIKQKIKDHFGIGIEEEREIMEDAKKSNRLKVLSSIIEDRLLGIHNNYGGSFQGISIDKTASTVMKLSAQNFMSYNYLSGASNLLQGKVMNFLEGVNGNHYKRENLRNAEKYYFNDLGGITKDMNNYVKKSKTNLLAELFMDTSMNFSMMKNNVFNNKEFRRAIGESWANGFNESSEHYIHSTIMYAMLDNIKIKNENGDFINKDGKVVERNEALSLAEAYEVVDGILLLKPNYRIEGMENMKQSEIEFKISKKMKEISANLYGQFDSRNKAMIQRYWYGKLAMFMRKWIVRTSLNRWQGVTGSFKSIEELELEEKQYSTGLEEFKEGTYVSFIRFVSNQIRQGNQLSWELMSMNHESLTEQEKGRIKQATMELLIMGLSFTSSTILLNLAKDLDDEEKKYLYHLIYLNKRLESELQFYVPPANANEVLRTMNTPSSAMNTVRLVIDTMTQLFNPLEVYEGGRNDGENKLWRNIKRFNPAYKNIYDVDVVQKTNYIIHGR